MKIPLAATRRGAGQPALDRTTSPRCGRVHGLALTGFVVSPHVCSAQAQLNQSLQRTTPATRWFQDRFRDGAPLNSFVRRMDNLVILGVFAVGAFLVAWVANGLVGLLSGVRRRDTGRLWLDIFFRFFAILELGFIGRMLSYVGFQGWPRKLVLFIGLLCVLLFLLRACHQTHTDDHIYTYPVKSP